MDAQRMLAIQVISRMQEFLSSEVSQLASEVIIITPAGLEKLIDTVYAEVNEYLEKLRLVSKI